jgi:hypothetical protein
VAKRQLDKRGIGYEALDNGFLSGAEPEKLQQICDSLKAGANRAAVTKMAEAHSIAVAGGRPAGRLRLGPFDLADGSDLTQTFDRPLRGREFSKTSSAAIWIWGGRIACSWYSTAS